MSDLVYRDICIRQGAEFREEYQRVQERYVHEARNAGTSDASAPTFPTTVDGTVVDNDITWLFRGPWNKELYPDIDVWFASTAYARRSQVISPVVPVDLTGYTGAFQIRATVDATTTIHTGTVQFGNRAQGRFDMIIATADTDDFTFDRAVYDLELTTSGGEVDFVVRGEVFLIKEVTR